MGIISEMNETERARFEKLIGVRLAVTDEEKALEAEGQSVERLDQQLVGRLSCMDALQVLAMALAQQKRRDVLATRLELNPAATRCIGCASA